MPMGEPVMCLVAIILERHMEAMAQRDDIRASQIRWGWERKAEKRNRTIREGDEVADKVLTWQNASEKCAANRPELHRHWSITFQHVVNLSLNIICTLAYLFPYIGVVVVTPTIMIILIVTLNVRMVYLFLHKWNRSWLWTIAVC